MWIAVVVVVVVVSVAIGIAQLFEYSNIGSKVKVASLVQYSVQAS